MQRASENLFRHRLSFLVQKNRIAETQLLQLIELRLLIADDDIHQLLRLDVLLRQRLYLIKSELSYKPFPLLNVVDRQSG